jgi:hypothetical protein
VIGGLAIVRKVLPERHGVLVSFNSGVQSTYTGDDAGHFVRVLARRAHPNGGAEVCLPEVGELGFVIEMDDLHHIWMGSLHWQGDNQVDPTPMLEASRHTSGIQVQRRGNGDMQLDHPSGLRITLAGQSGALPSLERTGAPGWQPPKGPCVMEIEHPSGTTITVTEGGSVKVKGVNVEVEGMASVDGGLGVTSGASGTFGTMTGQVVTVQDGIVTSIY